MTQLSRFPERLGALRKGRDISLDALAKALNLELAKNEKAYTGNQIGYWERGERTPTYLEVRHLAQFFDVSMDYLTGAHGSASIDLTAAFLADNNLLFDQHLLTRQERTDIYQLISGYLHGRQTKQDDTNEQLNLDLWGHHAR